MASRQKKGDAFYCRFVFQGRRRTLTVGKVSPDTAQAFAPRINRSSSTPPGARPRE